MSKKQNLIFDVDGTIWDSTEVVANAWNAAVAELHMEADVIVADTLKKVFGRTMDDIFDILFPAYTDPDFRTELKKVIYRLEHQYIQDNERDITFPDMVKTIRELSETYNLYIVSNCQLGYVELMMGKTGITPFIKDHDCYGSTLKPKFETIKILMERNGLAPETCIYIGDTMGDYESACGAGIDFMLAEYGFGEVPQATLRAKTPADIKNLL